QHSHRRARDARPWLRGGSGNRLRQPDPDHRRRLLEVPVMEEFGMNVARAALMAVIIAAGTIPLARAQDHAEHGEEHHVEEIGSMRISHAFMAVPEAGAPAVVFLEIENEGSPDRLLSASSSFAGSAEISGFTLLA